jgi:hypothetical protein
MSTIRRGNIVRRNDRCVCGSGKKFKHCCSPDAPSRPKQYVNSVQYIDSGEEAVRWVICDNTGVKFFSDKDNRILVFKTRADATAIALLDDFDGQEAGEINVAGVGPSKWAHLQEILPFVEVDYASTGIELLRERMELQRVQYESLSDQVANAVDTPTPPEQEAAE